MNIFEKVVTYGNPIVTKSFAFAIRVVNSYKIYLDKDRKLEPVYKQLLRSGTSIGANISEAQSAYTKKDFVHKMSLSLKESRETEYWLKLLKESGSITVDEFNSLIYDCEEISKLLTSIIKSAKSK